MPSPILTRYAEKRGSMLADLERLVVSESPSSEPDALHRCADVLAELGTAILGAAPERGEAGGRPVLRFGPRDAPLLVLGHLDTVHPLGTLERSPFRVHEGRAYGPGVFDMKAGLIQALYGLGAVREAEGGERVQLLITSDEELGSPGSRPVIEEAAGHAAAVLVAEPSSNGKLKIARKGVSNYELEFAGRAAHAGLEPENGANATVGLAHTVLTVLEIADPSTGTTVTPTMVRAGTSANTVPESGRLALDVRAADPVEQRRVDDALRALGDPVPGVGLTLRGGVNRPPLSVTVSKRLYELARTVAARLGLPDLGAVSVGGGSDGNFTAALGVETLDGLGAVGGGAHTDREWISVPALTERAALLSALIEALIEENSR